MSGSSLGCTTAFRRTRPAHLYPRPVPQASAQVHPAPDKSRAPFRFYNRRKRPIRRYQTPLLAQRYLSLQSILENFSAKSFFSWP